MSDPLSKLAISLSPSVLTAEPLSVACAPWWTWLGHGEVVFSTGLENITLLLCLEKVDSLSSFQDFLQKKFYNVPWLVISVLTTMTARRILSHDDGAYFLSFDSSLERENRWATYVSIILAVLSGILSELQKILKTIHIYPLKCFVQFLFNLFFRVLHYRL